MTLKNETKTTFSDEKEKIELKYASSKFTFIVIATIFFLVFYFAWSKILNWVFERILSPVYILLLISLNLFIFYSSQKIFIEKKLFSYIISWISILVSIFFILPVIL